MISWMSVLLGPIFAKEMIEMSRRLRYYAIRVLFGFGLLYAVYFVLVEQYAMSARYGRVTPIRYMASATETLVNQVGLIQMAAVYLLVPMFLCGVIAGERSAQTLEQLFTTHLTDREIVFGKLASRLIVMVMLILSGIPVLNLFLLFGGVSAAQVLRIQAVTLLAVLQVGAVGIYFATVSRSAFRALCATYGCAGGLAVLPLVSPVLAYSATVGARSGAIGLGELHLLATAVINGLLAWRLVYIAVKRLRDPLPPKKRWSPRWVRRQSRQDEPQTADDPGVLSRQAEAVAERMRAVWGPLQIAVVDREPPLRRNLWVAFPLLFAFFFNMYYSIHFETETMSRILLPIWGFSFILTVGIAVTNPLFGRRPGFFDLLLGTLLTPAEVLRGAIMVSGPWLVRIFLVPWVFGILWSSWNPVGIALVLTTGTLFTCYILTLGNLCSLADPRPAFRLGAAILFPIGILMGPWWTPKGVSDPTPLAFFLFAAGLFTACWFWTRYRISSLGVGLLVVSFYLLGTSLVAAGIAWAEAWPDDFRLLKLVSPWFWMLRALEAGDATERSFWLPFFGHWLAAAGSLAWTWHWTVRNFDRLTGRTLQTVPSFMELQSRGPAVVSNPLSP